MPTWIYLGIHPFGLYIYVALLTSMLSARSSSSESTTDSTRPDRSIISSGSMLELWMDVIVSLPLYAELVSLEWEPLLHF